jgi:Sporulation and spore germination/L,D-transpeptidase catalytic domain/Putative peptidoglycan binding domain
MRRAFLLFVLVAAGCGSASASQPTIARVYFMKGEQFHPVQREVRDDDLPRGALEQLFAGPTDAEHEQGIETALPEEIRLDSVAVRGGTATVEVSHAQTEPTPLDVSLRPARAAQIVYTLTDVPGIERVVIDVNGETRAQFEGETLSVDGTLDRNDLTHPVPLPAEPAGVPTGPAPADPAGVQKRLAALHYLPSDAVNGTWDYRTQQAVLAFQGWEGLARDGHVGPETLAALERASPPEPSGAGDGRRVEVYLAKGVTLLVEDGSTVRALHSSAGAAGFDTPPGSYEVFRKEEQSWSVPYQVWLPWASYFNGGIALHESDDVPTYPASHGCVRLPEPDAEVAYGFAPIGTPVDVH